MTPVPTKIALVVTLAVTAVALAAFLAGAGEPRAYLVLFTVLFAVRVAGQVVVRARPPRWLPPTEQWNLLPYSILLPLQLALLGLLAVLVADEPAPERRLVVAACLYWLAMGVRYAVRMARRPGERWFGGTIPIVFHCVLAAYVFVLGVAHA